MSLGPVMVDVQGTTLTPEEREMLIHPLVGGVILFTRNYESPEQLIELIAKIHQQRSPHLLVAVDHEGGRVQRFRDGFTRLPPTAELGKLYDKQPKAGRKMATTCGWLMAVELRAVGIDFSFAPVLDLQSPISNVIGDRAFHSDPELVAELAQCYQQGMQEAGMATTGKHFPGHGLVEADSHVDFPVDERQFDDIYAADILPFERMIRNGLAAVMPAHVIYSAIDPNPAGFSRFWIQDILRKRLAFDGVIFSDDLSMEAASVAGDVVARANVALQVGCDMVLVCNDPGSAAKVLDNLDVANNPVVGTRLARMRGGDKINRDNMLKDQKWRSAVTAVEKMAAGDGLEL